MSIGREAVAVDAHAHVISPDVSRYPPNAPGSPDVQAILREPFSVERLVEAMKRQAVAGALLVQRGQVYGDDNSYVCDAAALHPRLLHAVCGIDARNDSCAKLARDWIKRGAVGFRLMQPDRSDDVSWLGGVAAEGLWDLCADYNIPLCVHFFPWNRMRGLATLNAMMRRFAHTKIVVDHLSNAPLAPSGELLIDGGLRSLADQRNAVVKITTIPLGRMVSEGLSTAALLKSCTEIFGLERVLWGSDISQSPGTYEEMVRLGRDAVSSLPSAARRAVLADNVTRTYMLEIQR